MTSRPNIHRMQPDHFPKDVTPSALGQPTVSGSGMSQDVTGASTGDIGRGRMIFVDDNVRTIGGHFYELSSLLIDASRKMGFTPVLAANETFDIKSATCCSCDVLPLFRTRRMVRWSMGVDGGSRLVRDTTGRPMGGSLLERMAQFIRDHLELGEKQPAKMIATWSEDFTRLIQTLQPTTADRIIINTGDDFQMLALADSLSRIKQSSLSIDVIFHFALSRPNQTGPGSPENAASHPKNYRTSTPNQTTTSVEKLIGQQVRSALQVIGHHEVRLHATTTGLAKQWRETGLGIPVGMVPYPTRERTLIRQSTSGDQQGKNRQTPIKAVLAGLPRMEKGRSAIPELLNSIADTHLKTKQYRLSMQMPSKRWQALVPTSLHAAYKRSLAGDAKSPLEIKISNLTTADYHHWLDTADVGLFLYEPCRYATRCSGVLLEMMSRGVPVIVPDHCWLAEQVRQAGGHRSIGFIYQNRSEIPDLLSQFAKHQDAIRSRSIAHARRIQSEHSALNTLRVMGGARRRAPSRAA